MKYKPAFEPPECIIQDRANVLSAMIALGLPKTLIMSVMIDDSPSVSRMLNDIRAGKTKEELWVRYYAFIDREAKHGQRRKALRKIKRKSK